MAGNFLRTFLRTSRGTYCTLGGRGQNPVSGTLLLGVGRSIAHGGPSVGCGDRLGGLLKEPFAQAARGLRPDGDELLKFGTDWAVFCVNCCACAAQFQECVFSSGFLDMGSGILIRVSGVRVPPPLLAQGAAPGDTSSSKPLITMGLGDLFWAPVGSWLSHCAAPSAHGFASCLVRFGAVILSVPVHCQTVCSGRLHV